MLRDEVLHAVKNQRERYECAPPQRNGVELMNLILLGLYTSLPPGRAQEIRTLEGTNEPYDMQLYLKTNLVVLKRNGDVEIKIRNHKTKRYMGEDEVVIKVLN